MAVALRGNLNDFGIAEVFQLIGQQRKTGFLDISSDGEAMRLAFDAGRVVWARPTVSADDGVIGERLVRCGLLRPEKLDELWHASEASARRITALAIEAGLVSAADVDQIEELITDETIFTVLRCRSGSFDFSAQSVHHSRPREKLLAAEQILMDGLRRADEWQTFAALVPSAGTVFDRTGKTDGSRPGNRRREQVLALIDGRLPAQRIIDLSRLGLFDATRALAELHRDGLIAPLSTRQERAKDLERSGEKPPVIANARWWLAAALPLVLLLLLVSTIVGEKRAAVGTRTFPIVRAPLDDARSAFETRRLRLALDAERMASGRWPASLAPQQTEGTAVSALTPAGVDGYYYARRGNGIILLAPEQ